MSGPEPAAVSVPQSRVDMFFSCLANDPDKEGVTGAQRKAKLADVQLDWLKENDPEFAARLAEYEEGRTESLVDLAFKAAARGDPGTIRFLLERRHPDFAKDKGTAVQLNLTADDLKKLSDDELAELKRRCQQ